MKAGGTRAAMVSSAAVLLGQYGVNGTSFPKVLQHSGAPRGSIGYHFPGGKVELVSDALRWAGETVSRMLRRAVDEQAAAHQIFAAMCAYYRAQLKDSDFMAGCPVGATAQEAYLDETLRQAAQEIFFDWASLLSTCLTTSGHKPRDAAELADLSVAAIEGAILMARVERSTRALDSVERRIVPLLK